MSFEMNDAKRLEIEGRPTGVHAFTLRSTSLLLAAATGAQRIASDLLGRSVRLYRPVIELASRGQCQLLSSAI
jgi:hypothetical protein